MVFDVCLLFVSEIDICTGEYNVVMPYYYYFYFYKTNIYNTELKLNVLWIIKDFFKAF